MDESDCSSIGSYLRIEEQFSFDEEDESSCDLATTGDTSDEEIKPMPAGQPSAGQKLKVPSTIVL
jgi:hypothetical protein